MYWVVTFERLYVIIVQLFGIYLNHYFTQSVHAYCHVIPLGVSNTCIQGAMNESDASSRLILATVTSLSIGQFFIELQEAKSSTGST
jgi:hypothetical protein